MQKHVFLGVTLALMIGSLCVQASAAPVTLVEQGEASASIITAVNPTPSARLAALELQHHLQLITGGVVPILDEEQPVSGVRLLVGDTAATRALGVNPRALEPQLYVIQFHEDTVILAGRDWEDTPDNRAELGMGTDYIPLDAWRQEIDYAAATGQTGPANRITLPGIFDDQGTCYAVYDFLERFCGVRWYGPTPLNVVYAQTDTLTITGENIRRAPALKHRHGTGGGWPIVNAQWNRPSGDQLNLYWRRLRVGGEKWAGNHSFRSYQDRFLNWDSELFEARREDYFSHGWTMLQGERQFCYTNPDLIRQKAQDARDYFDGKGLKGYQVAMGDHFAVIPLDNANWCKCDNCQEALEMDKDNHRGEHFGSGTASHYFFGFVNAVAQEVAQTHPDKFIATLAYHVYSYRPTEFELAPNVSVAPCLQIRHQWAPLIMKNDRDFYQPWVDAKDRPIYLWTYPCFPMEPAIIQGWHAFPGFSARNVAREVQRYARDGVRGVFMCGIGEQVDYYVAMKYYDDPTADIEAFLSEFFTRYFGAAAEPMQQFHDRIEAIYSDPENYPAEVRTEEMQHHQNEHIAWTYLGTEERMAELGALMDEAVRRASSDIEKQRVETWRVGVWEYMQQGRANYLASRSE